MSPSIGLIGLGTMGKALARNIASKGFKVSVWNRTTEKTTNFILNYGSEFLTASENFESFVEGLERPRKIILMLPDGKPTEEILSKLIPALEEGDCVMDGANALFRMTEIHQKQLLEKGVHFLGTGVSGGEEGALHGPSLMPGGSHEAWQAFEPVLQAIAAEDLNGKACVAYMGGGGAGHYVKMVHNGIEYAEMQALAEAYDMLRNIYQLSAGEIAQIFTQWKEGPLESFLIDIAVEVLKKQEEGKPLLDLIVDKAGQKGTGTWTSQEALSLGVPTPSLTGSVFARSLSADKEIRARLAPQLQTPKTAPALTLSEFTAHLGKALTVARLSHFTQGFALLQAAESEHQYGLPFAEIARVWQGGCIIRCILLKDIQEYFLRNETHLYDAPFAHELILENLTSLRTVVTAALTQGVPLFALSNTLAHLDAYRRAQLPANFIQGLRDRFGAHGFERFDKEGIFHSDWK